MFVAMFFFPCTVLSLKQSTEPTQVQYQFDAYLQVPWLEWTHQPLYDPQLLESRSRFSMFQRRPGVAEILGALANLNQKPVQY